METTHRFAVAALFICYGLAKCASGFMIVVSHTELNFSAAMIVFGLAVPALFGGYNLLCANSSTHSMLTIASVIALLDFPIGTPLAVYYYWFWKYRCGSPHPFKGATERRLISA